MRRLVLLDRMLAGLLVLGAAGHTAGSISTYAREPVTLLWALCASVLAVLLGALNILRSYRSHDVALATIVTAGTLAWFAISFAFGVLIGNPLDPRPLIFEIISLGLVAFCIRTLIGAAEVTRQP